MEGARPFVALSIQGGVLGLSGGWVDASRGGQCCKLRADNIGRLYSALSSCSTGGEEVLQLDLSAFFAILAIVILNVVVHVHWMFKIAHRRTEKLCFRVRTVVSQEYSDVMNNILGNNTDFADHEKSRQAAGKLEVESMS
jgi:hypothetical protein